MLLTSVLLSPRGEGHGYHVLDGTVWGANIHLLHTADLRGGVQGVKECIECWAGDTKNCDVRSNGSFSCCQSNSYCPTVSVDLTPTRYHMRLEIAITRNVSMVKPVDMATFTVPQVKKCLL
jgi:hypothetical protein